MNKKILVISDSHGYPGFAKKAIEKESPFDFLVHCGDIQDSISTITGDDPSYEVKIVRGNCDFGNSLPLNEEFKAGFLNVWVTHGNAYNVKYEESLKTLKEAAKSRCADLVLFGHSHFAEIVKDKENNITLVNPGSICYPQVTGDKATYAVITVTDDYEVIPEIKEIEESL
ncbi:metallophosphoesterase family protein [Butyrivibrio sp. LC3010]|uniref:metallophosphoesterase family protein n=1 Tax=Butyrivibrio sp. LC3010 TaxID=1280680 RepID=UPI0003F82011|nr:metallophosphoesterase [Butyrivibrio sp. LC3010]